MKNPCYNEETKTDCPRRAKGCFAGCPDWQKYRDERAKRYIRMAIEREAETLHYDGKNRRRKSKGYK